MTPLISDHLVYDRFCYGRTKFVLQLPLVSDHLLMRPATLKCITCPSVSDQLVTSRTVKSAHTCSYCKVGVLTVAITLSVEMSSRKRKILTLEFSVGVTDLHSVPVHSVPVPIETQDLRSRTKYVGVDGCGSCT